MARLVIECGPNDPPRYWLADLTIRLTCCQAGHEQATEAVRCAYQTAGCPLRLYARGGSKVPLAEAEQQVSVDLRRLSGQLGQVASEEPQGRLACEAEPTVQE